MSYSCPNWLRGRSVEEARKELISRCEVWHKKGLAGVISEEIDQFQMFCAANEKMCEELRERFHVDHLDDFMRTTDPDERLRLLQEEIWMSRRFVSVIS